MSRKNFATVVDRIFDRFEVVGFSPSDYERPLDELFENEPVVIRWSADPREEIPDIEMLLKFAEHEDMRLVDRTLEYEQGGPDQSAPLLCESLKFDTARNHFE